MQKGKIVRTVLSDANRQLEKGSCVNTETVERKLSQAACDNGIIVYGNNTNERYTQVMMLTEQAVSRKEQVIVFDYGRAAFGLNLMRGTNKSVNKRRSFVRVSSRPGVYGNVDDYELRKTHGKIHARVAMSQPTNNYAYDLDDFTYDETTAFLAAYFAEIIHGPVTGTTFVLPALDAMIARRRHGADSDALRHLLSLLLRGLAKGHRFIFAAFSPDEIPNEYRNNIGTPVIGFSNVPQQIRALDKIVLLPLLDQCMMINRGVMMMPRDVFWAFASIDSRTDYVHALPPLALETDAGGGQPVDYEATDAEKEYIQNFEELHAEDNPPIEQVEAARKATTSKAHKPLAQKAGAAMRLSRRGYSYYATLARLASAAVRHSQGKSLNSATHVNADDCVDYALNNRYIDAINCWLARNRSQYSHLASHNALGVAMLQMAEEQGEAKMRIFVEGVLNSDDRRRPEAARNVGKTLSEEYQDAQGQYDILMEGWRSMLNTSADAKTNIDIANDNTATAVAV